MSSEQDRSQTFARRVIQGFLDAGLLTDWEIGQAGGPSDSYMTALRRAAAGDDAMPEPRRPTQRRIEDAAGWERGSAQRVWDGGEPKPRIAPELAPKQSARIRGIIETADELDEGTRARILEILDDQVG